MDRTEPELRDESPSPNPSPEHVNPLWFGEFAYPLLAVLRPRAAMLCADAQGFLRVAGPDGCMAHRDFAGKREALSSFMLLASM